MDEFWKCPVCGFKAEDETQIEEHIMTTGHIVLTEDQDPEAEKMSDSDAINIIIPGVQDVEEKEENEKEEEEELVN